MCGPAKRLYVLCAVGVTVRGLMFCCCPCEIIGHVVSGKRVAYLTIKLVCLANPCQKHCGAAGCGRPAYIQISPRDASKCRLTLYEFVPGWHLLQGSNADVRPDGFPGKFIFAGMENHPIRSSCLPLLFHPWRPPNTDYPVCIPQQFS